MHFRKPRRSTPSWLWSYTSSFCVFPERACWDVVFTVLLSSGHTKPQCSFSSPLPANFHGGRRGGESPGGPRPVWDVVRFCRPPGGARYSPPGCFPNDCQIRHSKRVLRNKIIL